MQAFLASFMDAIELSIFSSRIESVCGEMGAVLRRAAFSPNIKDRLDFSCAVFDAGGELCAQAAHIPVHLGSMAYAMRDIVARFDWKSGDMVVLNDPYLGGTHLPDVTLVAPFFIQGKLAGFVANRAHHADIGAATPGSMPISRSLDEEGMVIAPSYLLRSDRLIDTFFDSLTSRLNNPVQTRADLVAQVSANRRGLERLHAAFGNRNYREFRAAVDELNEYGERFARNALADIADGIYSFQDVMDCDGLGTHEIPIKVELTVSEKQILADFTGTAPQVAGNINCPLSVAAAAVYYVFRCLLPDHAPMCAGVFKPVRISAPVGCLVNARRPAAVAAGNVETSMRIVDVVIGALAQALPDDMPAASQGTMNNIAMGAHRDGRVWDYYETLAGGMGSGAVGGGHNAVQTHMTNTLNTPIESLEMQFPIRITRYAILRGSGGAGLRNGGDGLIREYEFLEPAQVTIISERRTHSPWGLNGGSAGARGENYLNQKPLPGKCSIDVKSGDRITIRTPGGGGWGASSVDLTAPRSENIR